MLEQTKVTSEYNKNTIGHQQIYWYYYQDIGTCRHNIYWNIANSTQIKLENHCKIL